MNRIEWISVATERQAVAQLQEGKGGFALKAGGVDLMDRMRLGISSPSRLVQIGTVSSMRDLRLVDDSLHIGPTVTLARLAADSMVRSRYAAIAEAAGAAANPQIRNVATVGGNLLQRPRCAYFRNPDFQCLKKGGDIRFAKEGDNRLHAIFAGGPSYIVHPSSVATALVALDARLRIVGTDTEQNPDGRVVSLSTFFTLPTADRAAENSLKQDELLAEIIVPDNGSELRSAYRSIKERQVFDWPLAEVAVSLTLRGRVVETIGVVLGAAAPIPWRATEAESALLGKKLDVDSARGAARAAMAGAKPLSHNGYKVALFTSLIVDTLLAAGS